MDKHYYYTGTDYGSMYPMHWDFWYHIFVPWSWHNWIMLSMLILYIWVKWNDAMIYNKRED